MPHCIVEYSQNVTEQVGISQLLDVVTQVLCDSPLFESANISVRGHSYTDYHLGTQNADFIHVTIRLFSGRTEAEKITLNRTVGVAIQSLGLKDTLISCECVDIHKASSFRVETDK